MIRKKRSLTFLIVLLVLFLGIGYAYLNTTLSINGTTDVDANTWNVYWDNVVVYEGSVSGNQVTTAPVFNLDRNSVSFQVRLSKPGDFYEFTVDAKNVGSIDAMIDTVTKTTNIPNYLRYTVTYEEGFEIASKQLLESGSFERYKVRVEYRTDINPSDLPATADSISLTFGVTYIQADNSAVRARPVVYSVGSTHFNVGSAVPEGATTFNNYSDAISSFGYNFFVRHDIENGLISSSYIGFYLNNRAYFIKGGTTNMDEDYNEVKSMAYNAFGEENCVDNGSNFNCSNREYTVYVQQTGRVTVFIGDGQSIGCGVLENGESFCGTYN